MVNSENWKEILESEGPSFGSLLKIYRELAGVSQTELRRRLKDRGYPISQGCLSNYETNRRRPDDPKIVAEICECLGFEEKKKHDRKRALIWALFFDGVRELASQYLEALMLLEEGKND
jgi:predicted transcriptional regulator